MILKKAILSFCLILATIEVVSEENQKTLNGIFFTSEDNFKNLKGINIDVDYLPDKAVFSKNMQKFLQKPLTKELLKEIKEAVYKHFHDRDYKFVLVHIDEKYLFKDVIKVVVINGKLGKVKVEGNKYFSSKKLAKEIKTKPGKPLSCKQMMKDLYWLNRSPFRSVNLIFEKGEKDKETDVVLNVADKFPVRVYSGYEHNGYPTAGNSRWLAGINVGNLFNLDQELNYQFSSAFGSDKWRANTISYFIPFFYRHLLKLYGANSKTKPEVEEEFFLKGKNWQVGGNYIIPWITCRSKNEFILGYEFKRTNNFMSYSKQLVYNKFFDISQFILGFNGSTLDKAGYTAYGINFFLSPGNMTRYNNTHSFQRERRGANSDYVYFRGNIDRLLKMPKDFALFFTFLYQFSKVKLLPSEQMSFGGYFSIRGYLENEVIADRGIIFKTELRTPITALFKRKDVKDQLQFLAFLDFGYANNVDPNVVKKENTILASIGPGFRYNFKDNVAVRFDYGFQLKTIPRLYDEEDHRSRLHGAITIAF